VFTMLVPVEWVLTVFMYGWGSAPWCGVKIIWLKPPQVLFR
jgi:hypothetical protein